MHLESVIKNGPFKGMKYPKGEELTRSSAFTPKLIGSYEGELHPFVEKMCTIPYTKVVNIGSGEGYCAIGFALAIPKAKVYAYDTDPQAIKLLKENIEANNINNIIINNCCNTEIFTQERGLLICDCEGCEQSLFTKCAAQLTTWDFIS